MTYDTEKISISVKKRRIDFIKKAAALLSVLIASIIAIVINFNNYVSVICVLLILLSSALLAGYMRKFNVRLLFSKEICGKNKKEYEYRINGDKRNPIHSRGIVPHTYANRKSAPLRLNGTVYLELDDGSIKSISGLYKSHMDIYEEGDVLIKYAGTRFPIVLNRKVSIQPCPICGEVNDVSLDACRTCGLDIIK